MLSHLVILIWSAIPFVLSQACYGPSGLRVDRADMRPCPQPELSTICCAMNRGNPPGADIAFGPTQDECLPNGVCQSRFIEKNVPKQVYYRNFCTEKDWKTGKCLDVCTDNSSGANNITSARLTPCDRSNSSAKWCCGDTRSCCSDDNVGFLIPMRFGATTSLSTMQTTLSSTSSSTPAPTPSSSDKVDDNQGEQENQGSQVNTNNGLSTGAKAGIGVGAALGVLVFVGLGFYAAQALRWKKEAALTKQHEMSDNATYTQVKQHEISGDATLTHAYAHTQPATYYEISSVQVNELPGGQQLKYELPSSESR